MAHALSFFRSRKGFDAFSFVFTLLAVSVLIMILVFLNFKYGNIERQLKGVGDDGVSLLNVYAKVDSALLYLDQSASLALRHAVYDFSCGGFTTEKACNPQSPVRWSSGSAVKAEGQAECMPVLDVNIPEDYSRLSIYFSSYLDSYISGYNEGDAFVAIPPGNYDNFKFGKLSDGLEVVGIASKPILVERKNLKYEVMPSFRESVDVDLVSDFAVVTSNAEGLIGSNKNSMESVISSLRSSTGLDWNLESYGKNCAFSCHAGDCEICRDEEKEECVVLDDCGAEDGEFVEGCKEKKDCKKVLVEVCSPGTLQQGYCSVTASVSVKIPDASYNGNKYFFDNDGRKEYAYRFALNWVEMDSSPECVEN